MKDNDSHVLLNCPALRPWSAVTLCNERGLPDPNHGSGLSVIVNMLEWKSLCFWDPISVLVLFAVQSGRTGLNSSPERCYHEHCANADTLDQSQVLPALSAFWQQLYTAHCHLQPDMQGALLAAHGLPLTPLPS